MNRAENKGKRGRPLKDYSYMVGKDYGFLRILELATRGKRQMVRTLCLVPGCKTVSVKRIDKVLDGTTISCKCIKTRLFKEWVKRQASMLTPEHQARIWLEAQDEKRQALLRKYQIHPAVFDHVVRNEQTRRAPGAAVAASSNPEKIDATTQWCDREFCFRTRILRSLLQDIGFKKGQRRHPVFNAKELAFRKNGNVDGKVAWLLEWSDDYLSRADREGVELILWLKDKVAETREHRKEVRRYFARKVGAAQGS